MTELLAIVLGVGVGLSLGALGGGGSTLAVPILVFVAGLSAQQATTASLLVVGVASAIGALGHHRNGNVRLGAGLAFGGAGIVGTRIGTVLNHSLDEHLLLLAFSALILFVAVRMYGSASSADEPAASCSDEPSPRASVGHGGERGGGVLTASRAGLHLSAPAIAKLAAAATGVGLLTGLFGVGGGFAVVPALTLVLGFEAKEAIGTSLVVIAMNAALALAMRWGNVHIDWRLVGPFLTTVTAGVVAGSRVAHRIDAEHLTRAFAVMLAVVALYTGGSTLVG